MILGTSREKRESTVSESDGQDRRISIGSKDVLPQIITKQKLEAEAKPKERSRRDSTDEEVSLKTEEPKDSDNESGAVANKSSPPSAKKKTDNKK